MHHGLDFSTSRDVFPNFSLRFFEFTRNRPQQLTTKENDLQQYLPDTSRPLGLIRPPDDLETTRQLHKERHTLLDATAAHLGYKKEHFIIQNQSTTRGQRQPVAQSFEM